MSGLAVLDGHAHGLEHLRLGLARRGDPIAFLADIAFGNAEALRQFVDPIWHAKLLNAQCRDNGPRGKGARGRVHVCGVNKERCAGKGSRPVAR